MDSPVSKSHGKVGRPRTDATPIMVRVMPEPLAAIDAWIAMQPGPKPSRPEAIRRLLEQALKGQDR